MTSVVDHACRYSSRVGSRAQGSRSRQFMPVDLQAAVRLATTVRDQMRRWSGPSETAHPLPVQERMLAQAFAEVIELGTPIAIDGQALDREDADPVVATTGAQAGVAIGDRRRVDPLRGRDARHRDRAAASLPATGAQLTRRPGRAALHLTGRVKAHRH